MIEEVIDREEIIVNNQENEITDSGLQYIDTVVGDGEQTRDFIFVTDIIRSLVMAAKSQHSCKIYNVGSSNKVSINQLVELLGGDKVYIPKRPGEPNCTFADISKIKTDLKWTPKVSINQGVEEILKNINFWKDAPIWSPYSIANATKSWFHYLEEK